MLRNKFEIFLFASLLIFLSCAPMQQPQKPLSPPPNWPKSAYQTEDEFRKYFDSVSDLDPIEGIWNVNEGGTWRNTISGQTGKIPKENVYRIGVVKENRGNYEFAVVILESKWPHWKSGFIKGYLRTTAYDRTYEGIWYTANFQEDRTNFIINKDGLIEKSLTRYPPGNQNIEVNLKIVFFKAYPPISAKEDFQVGGNLATSGSGVVLTSNGLIATNFHVVENAKRIEILFPEKNQILEAKLKIKDSQNDIAILGIDAFSAKSIFKKKIPFRIADANKVKTGQPVFTLGFPLAEIMGSKARLSNGHISSKYGLQDDPRLFQISNPIQPGNSGGPLFNEKGELVGMVVSTLNAKYLYEHVGIIPQNVNFAIKSNYLSNLLLMLPNADEVIRRENLVIQGSLEKQIEQLNQYVIQVKTYR